jgi:hypothetical protein
MKFPILSVILLQSWLTIVACAAERVPELMLKAISHPDSGIIALCKESDILEIESAVAPRTLTADMLRAWEGFLADKESYTDSKCGCVPFWDVKIMLLGKGEGPSFAEIYFSTTDGLILIRTEKNTEGGALLSPKGKKLFEVLLAEAFPTWRQLSQASYLEHYQRQMTLAKGNGFTWPNKALEPTTPSVTPAADAPVAPAGVAAHL